MVELENTYKMWTDYVTCNVRLAREHMKRCSMSLATREMQMNTTMKDSYALIRMATIKKRKVKTAKTGEDVETPDLPCIADGNVKWYHH